MVHRVRALSLSQAVEGVLAVCIFAVAVRFAWGRIDPDVRGFPVLSTVPAIGLVGFLHAIGRESGVATLCICIGVAGLVFWGVLVASGSLHVTRADAPAVVLTFAFLLASLLLGLYTRHRLRREAAANRV